MRAFYIAAALASIALAGCGRAPSAPDNTSAIGADALSKFSAENSLDEASASASAAAEDHWTYSADTDQMRGTKTLFAMNDSLDEVSLAAPYDGGKVSMTIRKKGRGATEVYFTTAGQFLCDDYGHSTIAVKFDNSPVQNMACAESSSGNSDAIFLESSSRFMAQLPKAKKLMVEFEFYDNGKQQVTYDVSSFKGLNGAHN